MINELIELLFNEWLLTNEAVVSFKEADVLQEEFEQYLYTLDISKDTKLKIEEMLNFLCLEQTKVSFEAGFNIARQLNSFMNNCEK